MDCSICRSMLSLPRRPRDTICEACLEGARTVVSLMNKLECDTAIHKHDTSSPNSCKPQTLANLPTWVNNMKNVQDELNEKINFLSGFFILFKEKIPTDILLRPGDGGPCLSAHRSLLAARSEIFKNMLDSDSCKAPANDTITLAELNHEELESLLEFLYSGNLPLEKLEKHVYSLTMAADKYEIPYLLKFCERHMLRSLDLSNVLDVLEISDVCSNQTLGEAALKFVVRNMDGIVFSDKYESFVHKHAHLALQVTRAFFAKNEKMEEVDHF